MSNLQNAIPKVEILGFEEGAGSFSDNAIMKQNKIMDQQNKLSQLGGSPIILNPPETLYDPVSNTLDATQNSKNAATTLVNAVEQSKYDDLAGKYENIKGGSLGKRLSYRMKSKSSSSDFPMAPQKPVGYSDVRWESTVKFAKERKGFKGIPFKTLTNNDKEGIYSLAKEMAKRDLQNKEKTDELLRNIVKEQQKLNYIKKMPTAPRTIKKGGCSCSLFKGGKKRKTKKINKLKKNDKKNKKSKKKRKMIKGKKTLKIRNKK
jgi:hypothetical protein